MRIWLDLRDTVASHNDINERLKELGYCRIPQPNRPFILIYNVGLVISYRYQPYCVGGNWFNFFNTLKYKKRGVMYTYFFVTDETRDLVINRLIKLGYEAKDNLRERISNNVAVRKDSKLIFYDSTRPFGCEIEDAVWGSLDELLYTDKYTCEKPPIVLFVNGQTVKISEHVVYGCTTIKSEDVETIIKLRKEWMDNGSRTN